MGQLGLDIEMAGAKGFCTMHFFSFFTLVWSQVVRMENRNWGIRCLVQVFICLFYSRSLLVFCFKCSSVSMSIPNSLTVPSPILPLVTIRLLQNIEQSSQCCPAGPYWLSSLNTAVWRCPSQSPNLSPLPL